MEKRMQKRSIITILLVVLFACITCLAVLFAVPLAGKSASGVDEEQAPAATVYLGTSSMNDQERHIYYYSNFVNGWHESVNFALAAYEEDPTAYVKVILTADWTARTSAYGFGDVEGEYADSFNGGRILSPAGTNIVIDLNGYKINRNRSSGIENGHAILVRGNLSIEDSSAAQTGKITGAYNLSGATAMGGGVYVDGGTFNLYGGSIEGNRASGSAYVYGIGVLVDGGTFNMYGGSIKGHGDVSDAIIYGGGVCVYTSGTFNMYGGAIENNSAVFGGGVATYEMEGSDVRTALNLMGGTISNNSAITGVSGSVMAGGGGVCIYGKGNVNIESGEISGNRTDAYGGGIFYYGSSVGSSTIYLGGVCRISDNAAWSLDRSVYGGGIALYRVGAEQGVLVDAELAGTTIENNYAVSSCESETSEFEAHGGGLYLCGVDLTMIDCTITSNRAGSFASSDLTDDLTDIIDGYSSYGGGVSIDNVSGTDFSRSSLVMLGGFIQSNRASFGGGVSVKGDLDMRDGEINFNEGRMSGGIYTARDAQISISGGPTIADNEIVDGDVRTPSNLQISSVDVILNIAGELDPNQAYIYVSVDESFIDSGVPFTQGFGAYNSNTIQVAGKAGRGDSGNFTKQVYFNPTYYIFSDSTDELERHIMVLSDGELGVSSKIIEFRVTYEDGHEVPYFFGMEYVEVWNYASFTYDDRETIVSVAAYIDDVLIDELPIGEVFFEENEDGEELETRTYEAGIYTLTAHNGDMQIEFSILVQSRLLSEEDLDESLTITLPANLNEMYKYDGDPKEPEVESVELYSVENGFLPLVMGEDYTVSYENNINAGDGTAAVVVTFINNYTGVVRVPFTINSSDDEVDIQVTWQVNQGDGWKDFNPYAYKNTFSYDGTDQRTKIRAKLTVAGVGTQLVYAKGVVSGEDEQNIALYLLFNDREDGAFVEEGEYTIDVGGIVNYPVDIPEIRVYMMPMTLNVDDSDFESVRDEAGTKLWSLVIGSGDEAGRSTLLDAATYVVRNQNGEQVLEGRLQDSYARYRGVELALELNGDYTLLNGITVQELLDRAASVIYTHMVDSVPYTTGIVGAENAITTVTTSVEITFDHNYTLNTITIEEKVWYIVTMTNALRNAEDGEEVSSTALEGWKYGKWEVGEPDSVKGYAFRPEHGRTVIYTYYEEGKEEFFRRFAVVYEGDYSYSPMSFYEVMERNGDYIIGALISSEQDYLYAFNYTLGAGNYRLEVTVPRSESQSGAHPHWYENDELAREYGVKYYEITLRFTFTVEIYELWADSYINDANLRVEFPERNFIEYTGEENRVVRPVITLYNKVLLENVDYVLLTTSVNAGAASLTIRGINNLEGEFTIGNAFTIIPASNGWNDVPAISQWTYGAFDRAINLISGEPEFGKVGLWFAISHDEAGDELISGLEHVTLDENGQVSEAVAAVLKKLHVGEYYLFGFVDAANNYEGLAPNPVKFTVFLATNSWEWTPSVNMWTEGEYAQDGDQIMISAAFGEAHILIVDEEGNVYFDSDNKIDLLSKAKAGRYTLTAYVDAADDYSGLDVYTVIFDIFKKPGLPWWVGTLIALGALSIAALIIFILWKTGVFSFVTDKIMVSIRTSATVEATLAAIRAAKMMEEGRKSVEEAKRRERIEELLKKEREQSGATMPGANAPAASATAPKAAPTTAPQVPKAPTTAPQVPKAPTTAPQVPKTPTTAPQAPKAPTTAPQAPKTPKTPKTPTEK